MIRLLAILAVAFIIMGGQFSSAVASPLDDAAKLVAAAEVEVNARRVEVEQSRRYLMDRKPLPALPPPPIMTDKGLVQAPTPCPIPDFPVSKVRKDDTHLPAIKTPPVKTEKGEVQAPNPRPTADFPAAKSPEQAADIKRNKGYLDGKAVVVIQENIHVNVMLSAPNNLGRKVAIEVKPGEYVLGTGTLQGWDFKPQKTNKVPNGYEIIKGREEKS